MTITAWPAVGAFADLDTGGLSATPSTGATHIVWRATIDLRCRSRRAAACLTALFRLGQFLDGRARQQLLELGAVAACRWRWAASSAALARSRYSSGDARFFSHEFRCMRLASFGAAELRVRRVAPSTVCTCGLDHVRCEGPRTSSSRRACAWPSSGLGLEQGAHWPARLS